MIRTVLATATAAATLALAAVPPAALAQRGVAGGHAHHAGGDQAGDRVGTQHMVFETGMEGAAHEQFLRGLALLHNFEYSRAAAAFREAQASAPDWVMPYWGEAMTHNHPLWEEQDRDTARAILARLAPSPEARRAKARSPREAQWLDAVETLYGEGGTKEERDHRYLAKLRAMLAADPQDIDIRAFTGLATLGISHGGRDIALYMQAAGVLEPGFITHPQHPGILHYLIHSYDDPVHAPLGERMAARYALIAPDAGHAQHMVSHIYHALGDWEASERANVLADAVVDRQRAAGGLPANSCGHYNEWLVYARLQLGKDASDIVSGCRAQAQEQIAGGAGDAFGFGASSSYAVIATWQGVDTGNWPAPLEGAGTGIGGGFLLARMMLAHGQALRHRDDAAAVAQALGELRGLVNEFAKVLPTIAPDDRTSTAWAERAVAQVEALRMLAGGQEEAGLAALRAAAEAESALPVVFGPPNIAKPSWELLGEELLARGRKEEAAEAFRRSLAFAPNRKLSNEGLAAATGG